MCLILTCFAAVIASILWYFKDEKNLYKLGTLALMYWGACLMWFVDCFFALMQEEAFLDLSLNDTLLGILIILCGVLMWFAILIYNDPRKVLNHKKNFA